MEIDQIDRNVGEPPVGLPNQRRRSTLRRVLRAILSVVIALLIMGGVAVGVFLSQSGLMDKAIGWAQRNMPDYITINPIQIAFNYFDSLGTSPDQIVLDIKYADYQKLAYKRAQALEAGILVASPDDFVPATIEYQGDQIKVKVRLKGDFSDHWSDPYRWSFRVQVNNNFQPIMGMREFSLQSPGTRGYLNEWVAQQMFGRLGVMNLRYDFIHLTVNGRQLGAYAIEEGFSKELVENDQKREGPTIRFRDDTLLTFGLAIGPEDLFSSSQIDSFQSSQLSQDDTQFQLFLQAKDLLESFRRGELATHQVFDTEKLATFFALSDLFGSGHPIGFVNMRFYYNPVTSLLEPIIYDVNFIFSPDNKKFVEPIGLNRSPVLLSPLKASVAMPLEYNNLFFRDPQFFAAYMQALDRLSQSEWLNSFFTDIQADYTRGLKILHRSYPWYVFSGRNILSQNQFYIQTLLHPQQPAQAYLADLNTEKKQLKLDVGNAQRFPIEILGVKHTVSGIDINLPSPILLPPKSASRAVDFSEVSFPIYSSSTLPVPVSAGWEVKYRMFGLSDTATIAVTAWDYLSENFAKNDFLRQSSNWQQFNFLSLSSDSKEIIIRSGRWQISRNLIVPAGYTFRVEAGANIDLTNSAVLLSYSPIQLLGEESKPVTVSSSDSTGQGIAVIGAKQRSKMINVNFNNLSLVKQGSWQLTSSITFYESPVDISNCQFVSNSLADDYLNIIRSSFSIDQVLFNNTAADAIDIDFSNGKISESIFTACGVGGGNGDCLDLSGSVVEVSDIQIVLPGDKGISLGERAQIKADSISIDRAHIGVASKDLSTGEISNLVVSNTAVGVAVFVKKSEYGPATLTLTSPKLIDVATNYIVERGSRLLVDGRAVSASATDVADMFYDHN
ncbi:hypothetical protein A2994_00175 [candidate division Kazan bacterium RIFCSPLOWO2_01_FULL_48_13]|uniref:Right handed beta helix domain-containing protein n=1 Tax=candidate division Kazan bacterium RIFCSPLOWO2_01_FULL_48_13 TaxID=1798539 RepID=A0A1F4PPP5_UNCK3|nr:MAG: hypothetical protein A2994_00175 [candidate division Kazan bacterium RIFCSPLOWO2_01_FULL_48_13]